MHYLFPPDQLGLGDFIWIPICVAAVLYVAQWARQREHRPISARALRRVREQYERRAG